MFKYKGYTAKVVELDMGRQTFIGAVDQLPLLRFEGNTSTSLQNSFERIIEDYLEQCARKGIDPILPVRTLEIFIGPDIYEKIAIAAGDRSVVTIKRWATIALLQSLNRKRKGKIFVERDPGRIVFFYRGYAVSIWYCPHESDFAGKIINASGEVEFRGNSSAKLIEALQKVVDNLSPSDNNIFPAKMSLEFPPHLYKDLEREAAKHSQGLSEWAAGTLTEMAFWSIEEILSQSKQMTAGYEYNVV